MSVSVLGYTLLCINDGVFSLAVPGQIFLVIGLRIRFIIDQTLRCEQHMDSIVKKISSKIGVIRHLKYILFNKHTLVQPILNYGAGKWGTKPQRYIRNVQYKAWREWKHQTYLVTHVNMGWLSSWIKQPMQVFLFWRYLHNHPEERTCKIVHK